MIFNFRLRLNNMPQLVPFYFVNQVVFAFIVLTVLIYAFSKYILPRFVRLFISRIYINKL
jgi:F-type H+-transporting ATPase subunit 8